MALLNPFKKFAALRTFACHVDTRVEARLASPKVGTRQTGVFTLRGCGLYADGVRSDA